MTSPDGHRARILPSLYLVAVGLVSIAWGAVHMRMADGWSVGEWMTNYSGGFVRRGLPGAVLLAVHRAVGIASPVLVLALQVAVYLLFLGSVYVLLRGIRWTLPLLALFFSPATLAFIVLDPPNGFKKEILLFAVLGVVLVLLRYVALAAWQLALLLSLLWVALVLSHEAMVCYLPMLAAPVLLQRGVRASIPILAAPVLLTVLAVAAAARHPGTPQVAAAICASVGGTLPKFGEEPMGICGGSIVWLTQTFAQAHQAVLLAIKEYHYYALYLPLGALAVLPAVFALRQLMRGGAARQAAVIAACAAAAFCASLIVYTSGLDWGRWIHIEMTCLLLLLLSVPVPQPAEDRMPNRPVPVLAWALLACYATCWTLPAIPIYQARFGYFGLYRYLAGYRGSHAGAQAQRAIGHDRP